MTSPIPLVDLKAQYEPLKAEIFTAWEQILSDMRLFLGPNQHAFEDEFSEFCGVEYAVAVSDGTTAVRLALCAAGVGPGDEVITVSHTFIATVEAILLCGATPVFVDIEPQTYLMDVAQVEARITPRTRAILPVHLYGQCVDMDPLLEVAARHGLLVIEDACQAHGAQYRGRRAGSLGAAGAFSFYFTKNLGAYGEGGMLVTNDAALVRRLRLLRDHGSEQRYVHETLGCNARMDELQAAVLRLKLPHLEAWNDLRRCNVERYRRALAGLDLVLPVEAPGCRHVYHLYVIRTPLRDELRLWLQRRGIGAGIHYPIPAHLQPVCAHLPYPPGSLPVTEAVCASILSLPMYPELSAGQVERVAGEVCAFFRSKGNEPMGTRTSADEHG